MLATAKKPVALIGAGAKLSGAIAELRALLDHLQIPAFATVHGLGAVEPEAPYYLGMVGMHGTRAANMALHETDLLLVFGARLDDRVTGDPSRFRAEARIVHFEIDPAQLDRVRTCDLPVIGDLARDHSRFPRAVRKVSLPNWSAWRAVAAGRTAPSLILVAWRSRPSAFWTSFSAACPKTASCIADVGQHQMWAAQRYHSNSPRGFITSGGLGAMGFALPAAIGAQLAKPETTSSASPETAASR